MLIETTNGNGASAGNTDAAIERDAVNTASLLNAGHAVNTDGDPLNAAEEDRKRWERNIVRRINRRQEETGRKVVIVRGRNGARAPYLVDLGNPIRDLRVVAQRCDANRWEDTLALDMERHLVKALRNGGIAAAFNVLAAYDATARNGNPEEGRR